MDERLASRDIVLIGAGHTNMHIVRMWKMAPIPDTRLTLISPFSRATYSGMLPGTLAGLYEPDEMAIDLYRFAAPNGVRVIIEEVVGLDPDRRRVNFANRPPIRFDVASVGIGSVPAGADRWASCAAFLPIKPMATFGDRFKTRLDDLQKSKPKKGIEEPLQVVVVGGGAAGVEVTLCLEARLRTQGLAAQATLVDSGDTVLRGYLPGTIRSQSDPTSGLQTSLMIVSNCPTARRLMPTSLSGPPGRHHRPLSKTFPSPKATMVSSQFETRFKQSTTSQSLRSEIRPH
jgi:NADH dehydrogenase FAD-containing subunit